jgi:hypothetical protein
MEDHSIDMEDDLKMTVSISNITVSTWMTVSCHSGPWAWVRDELMRDKRPRLAAALATVDCTMEANKQLCKARRCRLTPSSPSRNGLEINA